MQCLHRQKQKNAPRKRSVLLTIAENKSDLPTNDDRFRCLFFFHGFFQCRSQCAFLRLVVLVDFFQQATFFVLAHLLFAFSAAEFFSRSVILAAEIFAFFAGDDQHLLVALRTAVIGNFGFGTAFVVALCI